MERGVITEIPLYVLKMFSGPSSISSRLIGVTSHTTPLPAGEGLGEGPPPHEIEIVRKKVLLNLWVLWEKKTPCVREKTPQRVVSVLYHTVGAFYFSQKNTDEQNTQRCTETLSQPISQNLTATFSSNALWTLYAGGFLWARNVRQKPPWTLCALWEIKLPYVREKTPQRLTPWLLPPFRGIRKAVK